MFSSFERLLIGRYLWPGAGGRLVLLVAAIGCAGVAIGVASLVLVVSFMNGAETRLAGQISNVDGHLSVTRAGHRLADWRDLRRIVAATPGVVSATPTLENSGMITAGGRVEAATLQGLEPADLRASPIFADGGALVMGGAPTGPESVAIGVDLADRLGVRVGDRIAITSVTQDRDGSLAVSNVGFTVVGILQTKVPNFDGSRVILEAESLRALLGLGDVASAINVRVADPDRVATVVAALRVRIGGHVLIQTWREMNATFFAALAQEKLAMSIIISMVTVIALSNILSSMVMLVRARTREIAIVRTMGASRGSIARVFIAVGGAIGIGGEATGLAIGLGLKAAKDPLVTAIKAGMDRPWPELDALLDLPLAISTSELIWIVALVAVGVMASIVYPAWRAAAIDPAAVLRQS